jgi:hypothetical protein
VKNQENQKREKNQITMDGKELTDGFIPLLEDGKTHEILIMISAHSSERE